LGGLGPKSLKGIVLNACYLLAQTQSKVEWRALPNKQAYEDLAVQLRQLRQTKRKKERLLELGRLQRLRMSSSKDLEVSGQSVTLAIEEGASAGAAAVPPAAVTDAAPEGHASDDSDGDTAATTSTALVTWQPSTIENQTPPPPIDSLAVAMNQEARELAKRSMILGAGRGDNLQQLQVISSKQYTDFLNTKPKGVHNKYEAFRKRCKCMAADRNTISGAVQYDRPCSRGNCKRYKDIESDFNHQYLLMELFRKKIMSIVSGVGGVSKVKADIVLAIELFTGDVQMHIAFAVMCIARGGTDEAVVFAMKDAINMPDLPLTDDQYAGLLLDYLREDYVAFKSQGRDHPHHPPRANPVGMLEHYTDEEMAVHLVKDLDFATTTMHLRVLKCRLHETWNTHLVLLGRP